MAGSFYFSALIKGKGAHAALPHEGDDVILASTKITQAISYFPARRLDVVQRPCVVSVTQIQAGNAEAKNVLPAEATIGGTIRSYENIEKPFGKERAIKDLFQALINDIAKAEGVEATIDIRNGAPPCINSQQLYDKALPLLRKEMPNISFTQSAPSMTSEDFAYYSEKIPSLYFGLGVEKGNFGSAGVHTDTFTLNPDSLPLGVRLLVSIVMVMNQ
jgi:amidohydrolase